MRTTRVGRRYPGDAEEIAPGVVAELFAPAGRDAVVAWIARLVCCGSFGGSNAIEGIVSEILPAMPVCVIGDLHDVAVVVAVGVEL